MPNFYILLGVDRGADLDKIRSAYRRSAKRFHPDLCNSSAAADKFKAVTEAYKTLSDNHKRRRYDENLRQQETSTQATAIEDLFPAKSGRRKRPARFEAAPEDLLADIRPGRYRTHPHGHPQRDLYIELFLSPRQARQGGLVPVAIPRSESCPACKGSDIWERLFCGYCLGSGQVRSEFRFSLSLPPHTAHGTALSLSMEDVGLRGVLLHVLVRIDPAGSSFL